MQPLTSDKLQRIMRIAAVLTGMVWSSPNTILGLIIAGIFRGRWSIHEYTLESYHPGGLLAQICAKLRISAFTLGNVVVYLVPPTQNLREHEGRHTWQAYWLGPLFLPAYFLLMAFYGYRKHPMERDARAWEFKRCGRLGPSGLLNNDLEGPD